MEESRLVTAIDVGTTKVCSIIGRISEGALEVLAHSVVPCDGLKKGNVTNVAATARAIRVSVDQAQSASGCTVESAFVGVTGAHVAYENSWSPLDSAGRRGVITSDDLAAAPLVVALRASEGGRKVLHAVPIRYALDGRDRVRDPVGMHTSSVEVETHVVTGASALVDRLIQAVEAAGIHVDGLVFEPLASSEAVLTPEEKKQGAVVVDIGGGTTDVVAFKNGGLRYTAVIPVGGFQFTNDISHTYQTSYRDAEAVKLGYAHTEPYNVGLDEEVTLPVSGSGAKLRVPRRDICQLTRERAQELVQLIKLKVREADGGDGAGLSVVVTGGTSNLNGLVDLIQGALPETVRRGAPNGHLGLPAELRAPAYSTGVGILLWAASQEDRPKVNGLGPKAVNGTANGHGLGSRFLGRLRNLIPVGRFERHKGGSNVN